MEQEILPTVGACGVFTIDPVASFDPETQKDPEAIACRKLVSKKYVVFISEVILDLLTFYTFNFLNCFGSITSGFVRAMESP
jgi:hypothetical protein